MTSIDLLKALAEAQYDAKVIISIYRTFVDEFNENNSDNPKEDTQIAAFVNQLKDNQITELEEKLGFCLNKCLEEQKELEIQRDDSVTAKKQKMSSVNKSLSYLISAYREQYKKRFKDKDNVSSALDQHIAKLAEINEKISMLKNDVDKVNKTYDEKFFSLLTNTVAILGIFVALAFAGFGMNAVLPKIDISETLTSLSHFIKSIFFMLLSSLACYNLLLLLVYLIFKLSRPLFITLNKDRDTDKTELEIYKSGRFIKTVNLVPFFVVDIALFVTTIIAFVASWKIW